MDARILATVGGQNITEVELDAFIDGLGQRGEVYRTPEGKAAVLEELINRRLFLLEATRGLFEAEPAFKAQLKQAKESLLIGYAMEKALSAVTVKDAEVEKFYEENKEKLMGGDMVNASHILVADQAECLRIREEITSGKLSFEEAAKQYSSCPSGAQGGCLGDFGRGQMVPEFENACYEMEENEISAPVKTQFGYHLIRLNRKKAGEIAPLDAVRDELRAQLMRNKQQQAYQSKVNQLRILFPVDKF